MKIAHPENPVVEARQSARDAGLRYLSDGKPGFNRKKKGDAFTYFDVAGKRITDAETLRRIRSLAVPPAWSNVWIAPLENAHLQATGRDLRGRKQYRYHVDFTAQRDGHKFHRMLAFAQALPKIRRQVDQDLAAPGFGKTKVVAGLVRLLETTLIRIGNDEYARTNQSYGLTTMLNRHAQVKGGSAHFVFKGKSGVRHSIKICDRRLASLIKKCQELPGQELFGWVDDEGQVHDLTSDDVNAYLRETTGDQFTAKDFRTWAGTVLAVLALREFSEFSNGREAKKNLLTAIEAVSKMLGNTPSVCRKCYIHPTILDSYLAGSLVPVNPETVRNKNALRPEEKAVVRLLQDSLKK